MKDFSNSKNSINRRQAIGSTGALFAGLCVSPLAQAIKPITRASRSPLKLSLAAYSMRKYLPDTRRNPKAKSEMNMLGFVDYAATLGVEGAELTSYFMPSPLTAPRRMRSSYEPIRLASISAEAPSETISRITLEAKRDWCRCVTRVSGLITTRILAFP